MAELLSARLGRGAWHLSQLRSRRKLTYLAITCHGASLLGVRSLEQYPDLGSQVSYKVGALEIPSRCSPGSSLSTAIGTLSEGTDGPGSRP